MPHLIRAKTTLASLALLSATTFAAPCRAADATPLPQAHAHNDYLHDRPLVDALDHGFCSIEADIWRIEDELLVAHTFAELNSERTFEALYLKPLAERCKARGGWVYQPGRTVTLLVDLKNDGAALYPLLREQLAKYHELFDDRPYSAGDADGAVSAPSIARPVRVILSGDRPIDLVAADARRLCGIDGRLADLERDITPDFYPLVSDNWTSYFTWRGEGPMPDDEREKLHGYVAAAHAKGIHLRFWAAPDTEAVWTELLDAGVDLIGADDLPRLQRFLGEQTMDKNKFLIRLSESERTDFGRVEFNEQSEPQKVFSAIWALEGEVNGGGFGHYFTSSEFDTANFAPQALRAIGAFDCAGIAERALATVSSSPLPDSQDKCQELIDSLSSSASSQLETLDEEFLAYPDDLTELLYAYVASHPEVFGPVPE